MADISKITLPDGSEYNIKDANAQEKILVNGILEGDGEGGITASDIMDYETDTASGSVVSFTADSAAPFKSFIVNFEAKQSYRGYDKPWAGGKEKNKFNIYAIQQWAFIYCVGNNICFYGSKFTSKCSSGRTLGQLADLIVGETYILTASISNGGCNYILLGTGEDRWEFGTQRTITESDLDALVGFATETQSPFAVQHIVYNPMIRLASIEDDTYAPYANICPITWQTQRKVWVKPTYNVSSEPTTTIHLNQTVYSGNLDIISGLLTITSAEISSYNGETLPGEWLSDSELYDPEITPTTGAQVVYTLDTPIISHLTPIEISTLQGANNVWADDGNVTVTYRIGENALLRDVAEAVENLQGKINVNGILKSNGNGEVFLAEPGTDYATPNQIPTASTANPQMDGEPSPGSTGQWSDGGHIHPTDTTRAAAALEINGHSLTEDFDLTAADVGALASDGTAVSSYTLFPTKVYPGSLTAGWYKFAEVNITGTSGRAKITFKYGMANSNYDFIGDIFVYKESSIPMNCTMQIPYSVSGKTTYFRYNVDSTTKVSLYVYKHDSGGYPVFTILTSQDALGDYLDPSTYMLESLVAETPPTTALTPYYSAINRWIYNVPVSPGTNQQILSYSHNMITSASVLAKIEFANPEYIKSDCSWETTDGANPNNNGTITLTGTCTTATTANLLLLNVAVA